MDDSKLFTIFSIHFPEKRVYIEHTSGTLYDRMELIKNDRDHNLYSMLKEYPNPEIRVDCYGCKFSDKKLVASKYLKNKYKLLNVNVLPYGYKK